MADWFKHLGLFFGAVIHQYIILASGCALTVVIAFIERHILKRQISYKTEIAVLALFLFLACFGAWDDLYRKVHDVPSQPSVVVNVPPTPTPQVVLQPSKDAPMPHASISSVTKELPIETFASHGLPTTEAFIAAHGTISDPTFVLECNSACAYESAMSLSTNTLPESKQLSPTRIRVHFVVPAQLSDGQQVSIRVRSKSQEPVHSIKVRRVAATDR